jgi:CRP-like cAMP-binding protein
VLADAGFEAVRDRTYLLRTLETFREMEDESLALIAEHARVQRFRKGERLVETSAPLRAIHWLLDGQVRVTHEGRLLSIVGAGRGVGLLAFRAGRLDGLDAVALADTNTVEVPIEAVAAAYEDSFAIVRNDLRICASTLLSRRGSLPVAPAKDRTVDEGVYREEPIELIERVIASRRSGAYAKVNVATVIELVRREREVRYAPGEALWRHGDASHFHLRVHCGRVRCTTRDGASVDVGANHILGSLDALAQTPRSFDATAVKPVIAFRVDLHALLNVMEVQHELGRGLLALLASALLEEQKSANARSA